MSDLVTTRRAVELLAKHGLELTTDELDMARRAGRIEYTSGRRYSLEALGTFLHAERKHRAAVAVDNVIDKRLTATEPVAFANLTEGA